MKDMNYTYLEIKHLQLFAKSALIDEIIEMLKAKKKEIKVQIIEVRDQMAIEK